MSQTTSCKEFNYAEHLDIIKSIRQQLKDSDERVEKSAKSITSDAHRLALIRRSNSVSNRYLLTGGSFQLDESDMLSESILFAKSMEKSSMQETSQSEEEVETTVEYLKSIRRSEMFKSDKERFDFLVSEIEIFNKRVLILQCELQALRKENEILRTSPQAPSSARKLETELEDAKRLVRKLWRDLEDSIIRRTEAEDKAAQAVERIRNLEAAAKSAPNQGLKEAEQRAISAEQQNVFLNERIKALQAKLEATEGEKEGMRGQVEKQAGVIAEQARSLEKFKSEIIAKFVHSNTGTNS